MHRIRLAAAVALVAAASTVLPAQGLGVALGTLIPQGDLADGAKSGFVGIASAELGLSARWALRAEALWANSDLDGAIITGAGGASVPDNVEVSGDVKLVGGLGSVVFNLSEGFLRPYVLGGAGYYNRSVSQSASGAVGDLAKLNRDESTLGFHAGVGLRLSLLGITAFGEARYHSVNTDGPKTTFVPIVVGLRL
jgi:hypothetical protein